MLLAGVDGCVGVGELRYIWERGMVEDRLCGCGQRFSACPFWTAVVQRAFSDEAVDPRRMMALQDRGTRMRQLPLTFATGARGRRRLEEYPAVLARVITAIADEAGAGTVVDSSKLPPYGAILRAAPDVDLRVVHLVRDPRATAYSWGQTKAQPDRGTPGVMQRQVPWRAAALWTTWNAAAEALGASMGKRYLRLRYEDLIAEPAAALHQVLELVGTPDAGLPLIDDGRRATLSRQHTVAGNPDRFHDGVVELRVDDRWMRGLPRRDRLTATSIAAPLLRHYGYRFGSPR
jgi:hypothetical protein